MSASFLCLHSVKGICRAYLDTIQKTLISNNLLTHLNFNGKRQLEMLSSCLLIGNVHNLSCLSSGRKKQSYVVYILEMFAYLLLPYKHA